MTSYRGNKKGLTGQKKKGKENEWSQGKGKAAIEIDTTSRTFAKVQFSSQWPTTTLEQGKQAY